MQPPGCLGKELPCAIQFRDKGAVEIDGQKIHVMAMTAIRILEKNKWQVVEGGFWAPALTDTEVQFGSLKFQLSGGVFYERKDGRVSVRNLDGEIRVAKASDLRDVPVGYENWYRGVKSSGEVDGGIPRELSADAFVKAWNQTSDLTSEELEKYFSIYKKRRLEAAVSAAKIYKDLILRREVASLEEEQAEKKKIAARRAEQEEIRKLFRQRFFEPPELNSRPTMD